MRTIRTWSKIKMDDEASNSDASRLRLEPAKGLLTSSNTDARPSRNKLLTAISEKGGSASQAREDDQEETAGKKAENRKTVTIAESENKDEPSQAKEEARKDEEVEGAEPAEDKTETKSLAGKTADDVTNGEDPSSKLPDPSGIKALTAEISRRISKSSGKSHMSYASSTTLSSITSEAPSPHNGSSSSGDWDSSEAEEDSSKSSLSFDDGEESSSSSSERAGRD